MKKIILFILLLLMTNYIFAVKLGTLEGILKPDMIDVSENELYVLENGGTISAYSLNSLRLIRKFYLPWISNVTLMARLAGLKLHTIRNGTFYYLVEDEVEEVWELHAEVIKK